MKSLHFIKPISWLLIAWLTATICFYVPAPIHSQTPENPDYEGWTIKQNDETEKTAAKLNSLSTEPVVSYLVNLLAVRNSLGACEITDLHSPKIRVSGSNTPEANWLRTALGAHGISYNQVAMPLSDTYQCLERGVIDAILLTSHPSPFYNYKLYEVSHIIPWTNTAINAVTSAYPNEVIPAYLPSGIYPGYAQNIPGYSPDIVHIDASGDSFVVSNFPTNNYNSFYMDFSGNQVNLNLAGTLSNMGNHRILLKYDISTMPSPIFIKSAKIRLFMCARWSSIGIPITCYRISSTWSSSLVTWNTQPSVAETICSTTVGTSFDYYYWDITDLVKQWYNNSVTNYGVMLKGPETGIDNLVGFESLEEDNNKPVLEITYGFSEVAPTANFIANPQSGLAPLNVQFTDYTMGTISNWLWNFGDGQSSTLQNPLHQYTTPGIYTVSLAVTGPGGSYTETKNNYIAVYSPPSDTGIPPVANFTADPTTITAGSTVTFTDTSTGTITGWSWNFGDGQTSIETNPQHPYTKSGNFDVSLTVTGPGGSNTKNMNNYITVNPATLHHVTVSPTTPTVAPGGTQQFTATAYDQYNNPIPDKTFDWSITDATAGTIDADGKFHAGTNIGIHPDAIKATVHDTPTYYGTTTVTVGVTLTFTAKLQGTDRPYPAPNGYNVPLTFRVYRQTDVLNTYNIALKPGEQNVVEGVTYSYIAPQYTYSTANTPPDVAITSVDKPNQQITFTVAGMPVGTYHVALHTPHALITLLEGLNVAASNNPVVPMGILREGNPNEDEQIAIGDYTTLLGDYLATPTDVDRWHEGRCDLDHDGQVRGVDFAIMIGNYNKTSPQPAE